ERPPNLLNVTTHQLQYLVTMGRVETLSQAAAELGVSTSALSQALSELERRTGLTLFERRGRARSLNARGQEMVGHAERILGATRDLTLWAQEAIEGRRGSVRLGLIDIAAVAHFPDTLLGFRRDRPDAELHLTVAPSAALVEQVSDGRLDLAVMVEPGATAGGRPNGDGPGQTISDAERPLPGHPDLVASDLLIEELAVYGPAGRSGRRPPPAQWGPWVTFPPGSHTRRLIATAVRELGAEFRVEAESHQPEVLRQLVNLGLGWTVLPVLQAETEPNPLVRAKRAPLLTRRLVVVRRRATPIDPITAELIGRLRRAEGATVEGAGLR
ncbi:MAG: LysR family transcriptional regulator, partial [Actinomycetota bacterium]